MDEKNLSAELAAAPTIPDVAESETASGMLTARMLIERLSRIKNPENLDKPLRFILTEGGKPVRESRHWFALTLIGNQDGRVVFLQSEKDPPIFGGGDKDEMVMFVSLNGDLTVAAKPAEIAYSLAVKVATTEVSPATAASPAP